MDKEILIKLRDEFENLGTEERKLKVQKFFKEDLKNYGLTNPAVNKIAKEYYKEVSHLSKEEIFNLCEDLWSSGYFEDALVACVWSEKQKKVIKPSDFETYKNWIENYVTNWATCDTFCNHSMADFIDLYPEFIAEVKKFVFSENRWVRRAAAVTFIIPARKGKYKTDIFEIAEALLLDDDDMVRKGYGWMLKSCSQFYQQDVFEFVMKHKSVMPRTSLRYAIEKMPKELKVEAMKK